jgi:signal transduction histidine kinase
MAGGGDIHPYSLLEAVATPLIVMRDHRVVYANSAAAGIAKMMAQNRFDYRPGERVALYVPSESDQEQCFTVEMRPLSREGEILLTFIDCTALLAPNAQAFGLEREALRSALEKEQEINQMRYNLITTVSHELRTPLAVILAASELLERYHDRLEPHKRTLYLARIKSQIEYLREMLKDITFVTRGTIDDSDELPGTIDLVDVCQTLVSRTRDSIGMDHEFIVTHDLPALKLYVKAHYINRIVFNLLWNALKSSPPGSRISIRMRSTEQDYVLDIADQGPGITPDEIDQIFKPWRTVTGYSGSSLGMGLGLSVVQEYVKKIGGSISVRSELGGGSVFTVVIPRVSAPAV